MKHFTFLLLLATLFTQCREASSQEATNTTTATVPPTSNKPAEKKEAVVFQTTQQKYKQLETPVFIASLEKWTDRDSLGKSINSDNYLLLTNKQSGRQDTAFIDVDLYYDPGNDNDLWGPELEDLTDSLHFDTPIFRIGSRVEDDVPISTFVGYKQDSLQELFSRGLLISLYRADDSTLKGFTRGGDEIVNWGLDYPFTISLQDYSITEDTPAIQHIGAPSKTFDSIRVYQLINGDKLYKMIPPGVGFTVDTFYRAENRVRLLINDSVPVYSTPELLFGKIETNTAG